MNGNVPKNLGAKEKSIHAGLGQIEVMVNLFLQEERVDLAHHSACPEKQREVSVLANQAAMRSALRTFGINH